MNIPDDPDKHRIPEEAKGNPVYEQTRQDMPLWCCGRNCGRNSRIVVLVLGVLAIACSIFVCMSPDYFSFVSLRNDTFYDEDKKQPEPFEYATEANVGIFRYEILDVYVYPWPPAKQRELFDSMHRREVKRLLKLESAVEEEEGTTSEKLPVNIFRMLQSDGSGNGNPPDVMPIVGSNVTDSFNETNPDLNANETDVGLGNETDIGVGNETDLGFGNETDPGFGNETDLGFGNETDPGFGNETDPGFGNETDGGLSNETDSQIDSETQFPKKNNSNGFPDELLPTDPPALPPSKVPPIRPGSMAGDDVPTPSPSSAPSISNPNDLIDVDIGVVKPYPEGVGQFDQIFTNGQRGAMLAPIFATVGLFFSLIELCCCTYKCSWLPTAIFLYLAFMFQLMTLFLFMSEDFCKYAQDCALGFAGILSVVAVVCYMICHMLVCCTPRPPPLFNCCKKPPVRRKKKKKTRDPDDDAEARGLTDPDDDQFRDEEPDGYVDPYEEQSDYMPEPMNDEDYDYDDDDTHARNNDADYYGENDDDTRGADTHGESIYTDGHDTYESDDYNDRKQNASQEAEDYSEGEYDEDSDWRTGESESRRGID